MEKLMKRNRTMTRMTLTAVAFTLCGVPQILQAQSAQPAPSQTQQETPAVTQQPGATAPDVTQTPVATPQTAPVPDAQSTPSAQNSTEQQAPAQGSGGMVDPSKGPLTPVPSNNQELPN